MNFDLLLENITNQAYYSFFIIIAVRLQSDLEMKTPLNSSHFIFFFNWLWEDKNCHTVIYSWHHLVSAFGF
jgi:hypothetical protein